MLAHCQPLCVDAVNYDEATVAPSRFNIYLPGSVAECSLVSDDYVEMRLPIGIYKQHTYLPSQSCKGNLLASWGGRLVGRTSWLLLCLSVFGQAAWLLVRAKGREGTEQPNFVPLL